MTFCALKSRNIQFDDYDQNSLEPFRVRMNIAGQFGANC